MDTLNPHALDPMLLAVSGRCYQLVGTDVTIANPVPKSSPTFAINAGWNRALKDHTMIEILKLALKSPARKWVAYG